MLIRGIPIILYEQVETGKDAFNRTTYEEQAVRIENVIIEPISATELVDVLNLTGRRAVYRLCLPKCDAHDWTNKVVEFYGQKWRTFGDVQEWITEMVPLSWNRKVMVERINGQD